MRAFLAAAVFLGGFGLTAVADDKKPDDKKPDNKKKDETRKDAGKPSELDWRVSFATYGTVQYGCKLWDEQNYEGCFRLYQGFLVGILESLDHRPKLAVRVREHLAIAGKLDAINGALELRKALDTVQLETSGKSIVDKKSLWDRVGGEKAVRALVKEFVAEVRKDPKIDLTRKGVFTIDDKTVELIEQSLVELLSDNASGPKDLTYTGPRISMLVIGLKITDEEFSAVYIHWFKVVSRNSVPDEEAKELLELVSKYRSTIVGK